MSYAEKAMSGRFLALMACCIAWITLVVAGAAGVEEFSYGVIGWAMGSYFNRPDRKAAQ